MEHIRDLSAFRWIDENTDKPVSGEHIVSECVPKVYDAYCKIFHPMYVDPSVDDKTESWAVAQAFVEPKNIGRLVRVGTEDGAAGERILWRELLRRYDLQMHPEVNDETLARAFPDRSWPRHIVGPDEGTVDRSTCESLVNSLEPFTGSQECFFYYDIIATRGVEMGLLYKGRLNEVYKFFNLDSVYGTPTYWWPEDRGWCLCTDWDLTFTLAGGPREIVDALLSEGSLECIEVNAAARVDYLADKINL